MNYIYLSQDEIWLYANLQKVKIGIFICSVLLLTYRAHWKIVTITMWLTLLLSITNVCDVEASPYRKHVYVSLYTTILTKNERGLIDELSIIMRYNFAVSGRCYILNIKK